MAKLKENLIFQVDGQDYDLSDVISMVKEDWKAKGNKMGSVSQLDVYVKPEDSRVYYVVNKETEESVDF